MVKITATSLREQRIKGSPVGSLKVKEQKRVQVKSGATARVSYINFFCM